MLLERRPLKRRSMEGQRKQVRQTRKPLPEGTDRLIFEVPEEQGQRFRDYALQSGETLVGLFRRIADLEMGGEYTSASNTANTRVKVLAKAPMGPWREAIEQAISTRVLSPDVMEMLEARDGDVFIVADGYSLEGAGIFDGAYLLMRYLNNKPPRRGEICLVQILREGGECESTIKRWMGGDPPRLEDGDEKLIEVPAGTTNVIAVARVVGQIARI